MTVSAMITFLHAPVRPPSLHRRDGSLLPQRKMVHERMPVSRMWKRKHYPSVQRAISIGTLAAFVAYLFAHGVCLISLHRSQSIRERSTSASSYHSSRGIESGSSDTSQNARRKSSHRRSMISRDRPIHAPVSRYRSQ